MADQTFRDAFAQEGDISDGGSREEEHWRVIDDLLDLATPPPPASHRTGDVRPQSRPLTEGRFSSSNRLSRRTSQQESVVPSMAHVPALAPMLSTGRPAEQVSPQKRPSRSPVKQAPPAKKKQAYTAASQGGTPVATASATRSGRTSRSSSGPAVQQSPMRMSDLAPATEIAIQFSDLKLRDPGTSDGVLEMSELSEEGLRKLKSWRIRETGPDGKGSYAIFKAWMWKVSAARIACLCSKVTTKADSTWNHGQEPQLRACDACAYSKKTCRPCIWLFSEHDDNGEEKRQLVLLPKSIEEPWDYWGEADPPPSSRK